MSVVIVGAGQAGFQAATSLRIEGYVDPITLINGESHLPYYRPPLSKNFLAGKDDASSLPLRPLEFYEEHGIHLLNGEKLTQIQAGKKTVTLASGTDVDYEWLILATGARVRPIPLAPDGICYLRTIDDAVHLKDRIEQSTKMITVGAGFIGLEAAAVAVAHGKSVAVVAAEPRPMSRVVSPLISTYFAELHEAHGVKLMLDTLVRTIEPGYSVHLQNGECVDGDLVVAGIGVVANDALAVSAGLMVKDGIRVDQYLRTSDQNIFAIGDCASHPNRFFGGAHCRLESVQNSVDQARCVASTIAGKPKAYTSVPWFWTDQFEQKLQVAGLPSLSTEFVRRGDIENRKFSIFGFLEGRLQSVESVNRPADHMLARKLLDTAGHRVTPQNAADSTFDLKSLLT